MSSSFAAVCFVAARSCEIDRTSAPASRIPSGKASWAAREGVAPLVAREIWRVIAALRHDCVATIIVDRNVGAVSADADRCAILVKGQIIADLPSSELWSRTELLHRHLGV